MEERLINIKEFQSHFGKSDSLGVLVGLPRNLSKRRSSLLDAAVLSIATPGYKYRGTGFVHTSSFADAVDDESDIGVLYVASKMLNGYAGHIIGFRGSTSHINGIEVPLFIPKWGRKRWKND